MSPGAASPGTTPAKALPAKQRPLGARPADSPTVLLLEAHVVVRLVIADYLRTCLYRVYEVADTDEALAVLATDRAVDVVLAGVRAAGSLDGFGLARWVRLHRPGTRVVLSSGIRRTAPASCARKARP